MEEYVPGTPHPECKTQGLREGNSIAFYSGAWTCPSKVPAVYATLPLVTWQVSGYQSDYCCITVLVFKHKSSDAINLDMSKRN